MPPNLGTRSPLSLTLVPLSSPLPPLLPSMPLYLTLLHLTLDFTNSNMTFLISQDYARAPCHRFLSPHLRVHLIIAIITGSVMTYLSSQLGHGSPEDHAPYLISLVFSAFIESKD